MKYWRNIITERRVLTDIDDGWGMADEGMAGKNFANVDQSGLIGKIQLHYQLP
jgi:hypothetical protein